MSASLEINSQCGYRAWDLELRILKTGVTCICLEFLLRISNLFPLSLFLLSARCGLIYKSIDYFNFNTISCKVPTKNRSRKIIMMKTTMGEISIAIPRKGR